ncbi:MAG: hypothetical protein U0984_10025, partial [Prosthecobacter sp.]|nr:hypothetical protein [Prosthecobacter sp.]
SMRGNAARLFRELKRQMPSLPETVRPIAQSVLAQEQGVLEVFGRLLKCRVDANLTRLHGDFHLGQVLNTGHDFVVIDFEGEPRLSLSERRMKRSALRDVASMVRSFDYAAAAALQRMAAEELAFLQPWAQQWVAVVSQQYLNAYFATAGSAGFIPKDTGTTQTLLDLFLLDKAIYEIGYELSYRPNLVGIPLAAVEALLQR